MSQADLPGSGRGPILLVFPFQGELEAFLQGEPAERTDTLIKGYRVHSLASQPSWRMAVCGQGKVEGALACQCLSDVLNPAAVLLLGSATALAPDLQVGCLVLADPGIEWDFGSGKPPSFRAVPDFPALARVAGGAILSGDRDVCDPSEKAGLHAQFAAEALAWEGAGFHRFLRHSGKPGWEIRVITETAQEGRMNIAQLKELMAADFPALRAVIVAAFA